MKVLFSIVATVALALSVVAVPAGCATDRTRTNVLAPGLASQGSDMKTFATEGVALLPQEQQEFATEEVNTFFAAVDSKDRHQIAFEAVPRWGFIKTLAESAINWRTRPDGPWGDGVAGSALEYVVRYEVVLNRLASPGS